MYVSKFRLPITYINITFDMFISLASQFKHTDINESRFFEIFDLYYVGNYYISQKSGMGGFRTWALHFSLYVYSMACNPIFLYVSVKSQLS